MLLLLLLLQGNLAEAAVDMVTAAAALPEDPMVQREWGQLQGQARAAGLDIDAMLPPCGSRGGGGGGGGAVPQKGGGAGGGR